MSQDGSGDHLTIASALSRASAGTVIRVRPGVYAASLTIRAQVTIVADGPRGSVELNPRSGTAVTLAADAVLLTDLVLRGNEDDLPAVDAVHGQVTLDGCEVAGSGWTALLSRGTGSLAMRGCRVTNPDGAGVVRVSGARAHGVLVSAGGRGSLTDCVLTSDTGGGIRLVGTTPITVAGCTVHSNQGAVLRQGRHEPALTVERLDSSDNGLADSWEETQPATGERKPPRDRARWGRASGSTWTPCRARGPSATPGWPGNCWSR
ncbi:right-handed parallel beta-helix repeat-containing protein [Streptomyces sp. NPDC013172]|uniref:right-handed parallel beta-helix repeat-containing protein n=1 Tax=Streptomyces sp. NPDC013172 TaxID=3155009 RepID=UPI0033EBC7DC